MILTFPEYHRDPSRIDFTIEFILDKYNYPEIDFHGNKKWRNKKGQLHRLNGPAYIGPDGYQAYWINGKRHRENGPAIIHTNGLECYYQNDKLHRLDGPARTWSDGSEEYWEYGIQIR